MAVEMPVLVKTFEASGDLSTKQFYFMKQDTTVNRVTTCTATTDIPNGILQNKPDAAGKEAEVMMVGLSKGSADAALTLGDLVGTSADGQVVKKTVGTDTTHYIVGRVLEAATAAADIVTIAVNCLSPTRAA